ncbi:FAD-dependent oxidoreductase [Pseudothermotoga sp.]|nr:NAD(P)/FAD-dependent oxidoreductase [Pseudothermotoga sp.]MCX7812571.1 NAD(P)/FAD-dependent oxidoreductase [Pseudothermotoga sp.]MDW8138850.1 NAD(P)/FAD-dependent oxidoreductase [Pseudothermotoga sp.]
MSRLKRLKSVFERKFKNKVEVREKDDCVILEGLLNDWQDVVKAGKIATKFGFKGVVNLIECRGLQKEKPSRPTFRDAKLEGEKVDVLIIGAGVVGCSVARELSKWRLKILVVDKEPDVARHQSSRNAGMIHPPIAPKPGTKKAIYNKRGLDLLPRLSQELNFPLQMNGLSILSDSYLAVLAYPFIQVRAKKNGVERITLMSKERLKDLEPNVFDGFSWAYVISTSGIVDPFKMTLAFAENAVQNGAKFCFETFVESMDLEENKIVCVHTNRGRIFPKVVVNASGLWSDYIAELANDRFFSIHPRKGEMAIIDKKKANLLKMTLSKPVLSQAMSVTKGGGLIPTVHGNLLLGPTAKEVPYREDYSTSEEGMNELIRKHMILLKGLSPSDIITYFAGTRAATYEEDFIVEKSSKIENLVHAAGIQSPGLTSAPAIAEDVAKFCIEILSKTMNVVPNEKFNPRRVSEPQFNKLSIEEKQKLISENPNYGVVVCRCETVTKQEVINALKGFLPARTLDGIKWRTRCGMGRCQGSFCTPNIVGIISEIGIDPLSMRKNSEGSELFIARTRGVKL